MREFLQEHPDLNFIDKDTFFSCFHKIRSWLDLSVLVGYLMKYDLVKSSTDMETLTSAYLRPQDRLNSLVKMVEVAGEGGFMLLYMCLRESSEEVRGHESAVAELEHCGE